MTAMTMTKLIEPRKFEIQYKEDRNFKNAVHVKRNKLQDLVSKQKKQNKKKNQS